jgi:hypothetical protein
VPISSEYRDALWIGQYMIRKLKRHLKRMAKQSPVIRKAHAELVER